jgi:hypothetical protein
MRACLSLNICRKWLSLVLYPFAIVRNSRYTSLGIVSRLVSYHNKQINRTFLPAGSQIAPSLETPMSDQKVGWNVVLLFFYNVWCKAELMSLSALSPVRELIVLIVQEATVG